ncbi:MAG: hypothetical protein VKJ02_13020 [Snowella sp.]|nr:hypothetical protein [Snowella sp.]
MQPAQLTRFTPAQTLDEIYQTLSPEPLATEQELEAFYCEKMNETRGGDKIQRLKLGLKRAWNSQGYYKACLMGHPGVGKSTELNRLINDLEIKQQFQVIKFNVLTDLDPINFNPLDIILLILIALVEETEKIVDKPADQYLQELKNWYNTTKITQKENRNSEVKAEAGAGVKENSLWNQILALFASIKGEIRFASSREKEVIEYRFKRINDLIKIANNIITECKNALKEKENRQWLIIGENFDKNGVSPEAVQKLFIDYNNIIHDLNIHLIFTIPIGLYNSSNAIKLAFSNDKCLTIPDTAVFNPDNSANDLERRAIHQVLENRVNLSLFAQGQLDRIIIASGGNIRDLFTLVLDASDEAILSGKQQIESEQVSLAIGNLKTEYERRLGQNPFDLDKVDYPQKLERLLKIYNNDQEAQIPDEVLYVLLNNRSVQEVPLKDGERYFRVHPLVVDLLYKQGKIDALPTGEVPGGTSS